MNRKVIVWGHPLNSHTSSYVHYGYYRAFKSLGYETLWLTDADDTTGINFDNCIFLTEGQVDKKIPINNSSFYVLHNCNVDKYRDVKKINIQFIHNAMNIDVSPPGQHPTFRTSQSLTRINDYTYVCSETIFQPWATDLLPHEINLDEAHNEQVNRTCYWIGTYGGGDTEFQNHTVLDPFFNECRRNSIDIKIIDPWSAPVSPEKNRELIHNSFLSPSIQGPWQVRFGYAPQCRLLKNISYGHFGITNSIAANNIFGDRLIYSEDSVELFHKAMSKKSDSGAVDEIKELMKEVREHHTFVNRINVILSMMDQQ